MLCCVFAGATGSTRVLVHTPTHTYPYPYLPHHLPTPTPLLIPPSPHAFTPYPLDHHPSSSPSPPHPLTISSHLYPLNFFASVTGTSRVVVHIPHHHHLPNAYLIGYLSLFITPSSIRHLHHLITLTHHYLYPFTSPSLPSIITTPTPHHHYPLPSTHHHLPFIVTSPSLLIHHHPSTSHHLLITPTPYLYPLPLPPSTHLPHHYPSTSYPFIITHTSYSPTYLSSLIPLTHSSPTHHLITSRV